jgi:hypothetical protein
MPALDYLDGPDRRRSKGLSGLLDFQSVGEAAVLRWQTAHLSGGANPHCQVRWKIEAALVRARDIRAGVKQSVKW